MIPKLHYISQGNSPKEHLDNIQKACSSGSELVQLRLKNISEKKCLKLATEAREITSHFQTRLIINDYYKIAKAIKADGVHLGETDCCPLEARKHLYTWQIIGGTANTLQDCETLISKQVDYISLSPFRHAVTKGNIFKVLGLNGYNEIIEALKTETPIIGFGGINTKDVTAILETGISGIAVSDVITKNFDVIRTFNQLLKASSTKELRHTFK
ncbi:thiamine-phosphate diphosphorylase [Polaribacter sp. Hel1_33_78]|jgi:thiamine-phosphate pyrophosphorylase|uniref:thiamine phosphate synthase n=1 Tax=unclassified Polaribacter TaxID=196858 RepID=UPI00052E13A8|nr:MULTISPECIES: thiamine phosphate synthase [unclassified Polaribacter]KGL60971.1 thiamine-phosphate pyrophosphorylase [Polaribacter sp. Hel1_33_49]MDG1194871.1 thiamine phosphate synthase [Polaribacter sp.]PKV64744.1 thiamine-phosphate pyrophosphorylase [Polaribacter sp. Hel1_33_96]SDU06694.1 thiamine-phosphate diphosphorylase [Polaribacter sp. Hel1_33_78]